MNATITRTITIVSETCCSCGVVFGLESEYQAERRRDRRDFHCPNGHPQHYTGKTEAEKLRDQLASERARHDQAMAAANRRTEVQRAARQGVERRLRAHKGVITRIKRKVSSGRCPCCSREFKDLERHMKADHPKYNPEKGAEAIAAKES